MVGFDRDLSNKTYKELDYVIAGATSGSITRTIFQPLDVIKIRFQLQIEPIHRKCQYSKYRSFFHALRVIVHEEGIQAFWKGMVPAQMLSVSYGALQFLSFEIFTQNAKKLLPEKAINEVTKPVVNFTCGSLAGLVATVGSFPFDVTRTRLVAQGEPKIYNGMFHAITSMVKTEGPLSCYKGLTPTLIQIMPNAGFQFAFYRLFQEFWTFSFKSTASESSTFRNGCCGAAAGMAAKIAIYPLDLIKKRIQVQGFEEARKQFGSIQRYKGFFNCIYVIFKKEKIFGFYKGLWPSFLKAAFTSGSHFLYYEETLRVLAYFH